MKNLVIIAVLLLSMAELGYSTVCYTCTLAISDQSCTQVTNCTGSTPFCGTSVINGVLFKFVSKFCSAACVTASQNFTVVSARESCCQSDYCNNMMIGDVNNINLGNDAGGLAACVLLLVSSLLGAVFAV